MSEGEAEDERQVREDVGEGMGVSGVPCFMPDMASKASASCAKSLPACCKRAALRSLSPDEGALRGAAAAAEGVLMRERCEGGGGVGDEG